MSEDPLDRILRLLPDAKQHGDSWQAHCPAHEDDHASLSITMGEKGVVLHDHAGCEPDAICRAVGLSLKDLFLPSENGRRNGHHADPPPWDRPIAARYPYTDERGQLLYEVVRFGDVKGFMPRRPNGKGGFTWDLRGVRMVLYRLPEVLGAIADHKPVYLPEGEKDCDNLRAVGLFATTNQAGAEKWRDAYTESLRNAHVVLLPDNDPPGMRHVHKVAAAMQGVAASVRIVELPGLKAKGDVSDWLAAGGTAQQLHDLAAKAPKWTPPPTGPEPAPTGDDEPTIRETDLGNARRLVQRHGADLRYAPEWGTWLLWDGQRWKPDKVDAVRTRAHETVGTIYAEAAELDDDDQRKRRARWAIASEAEARISSMLREARVMGNLPVLTTDLDRDPWLLSVANGTLDLRTGQLRPARREDLLTKASGAAYDPAAHSELWLGFLLRVLPDPDIRAFVQRAAGYSLTGDVSEQCLFFLHGAKGCNGKSTFLKAILEAMGDYALQGAPDLLLMKSPGAVPTDVADLQGKRFVTTIEVEDGRRMAEAATKQLTGGDRLTARRMRQDYTSFEPTHKIWLAANHKPVIRGTDYAIWRRIHMVPFDVQIPEEERDGHLGDKLREEMPGILRWAVEGCLEWRQGGMQPPDAVKAATAEYRSAMDVLGSWFEDCIETHRSYSESAGALYTSYKRWCESNGEQTKSQRSLGTALVERGFVREHGRAGWYWMGLRLKEDEPADDSNADPDPFE
jgi:putative DNA primase/helicase